MANDKLANPYSEARHGHIQNPKIRGRQTDRRISCGYRRALAERPSLIPLLKEQTMTAGSVLVGYERVAIFLPQ